VATVGAPDELQSDYRGPDMRFEPISRGAGAGPRTPRVEVLRCEEINIGRFHCPPELPAWSDDNRIGGGALMVVPHHAVEIRQAGKQTVQAHPGQAVFYRRGQIYRRRLVDPRGDRCVWIHVGRARWVELAARVGIGQDVDPDDPFPFERGPIDPRDYRAFAHLLWRLGAGMVADSLALEEALLPMVEATMRGALEAAGRRASQRPTHATLGARAEAMVAASYREHRSLTELAQRLDTSPAHLARVFRQHTGRSIHQYRLAVRLAASIDLLAAGGSITDIGMALGFASPSHFATTFRQRFGCPPSAFRGASASARRRALERAGF